MANVSEEGTVRRTVVLVLGDIGRSPRMQYHALSLSEMEKSHVHLVGYAGAEPFPEVRADTRITIHHLAEFPLPVPKYLFILWAPVKVILQILQLFWLLLLALPRYQSVIVQNPPGLPALLVVRLATWLLSARFVIDWHNMGYTLLAIRFGNRMNHPFVRFARMYERVVGRSSDENICVTEAMRSFLEKQWSISAKVMHDHPPRHFKSLGTGEKHELFLRLERDGCLSDVAPWLRKLRRENADRAASEEKREIKSTTSFSYQCEDAHKDSASPPSAIMEPSRPALLVSSTSWTPDEDLTMLLDAAKLIDEEIHRNRKLPPVLIVITGRGPMLESFLKELHTSQLKHVKVVTAWLKSEDYPKLLGAADIGVSLHTSSSGLDLPMKVVDMFGCGLPVCAHGFKCVGELVRDGINGYIFNDAKKLAAQICDLLKRFPKEGSTLREMRARIEKSRVGWSEAWKKSVMQIFQARFVPGANAARCKLFTLAIVGGIVALFVAIL